MLDPTQGTSYFVLLQHIFGPARDQGKKVETCCAKEIILINHRVKTFFHCLKRENKEQRIIA